MPVLVCVSNIICLVLVGHYIVITSNRQTHLYVNKILRNFGNTDFNYFRPASVWIYQMVVNSLNLVPALLLHFTHIHNIYNTY